MRRLASFSRLILFDRRGTGLSDPLSVRSKFTLDEWAHDVEVVLEAAGSTRTALFAAVDSGPIACRFAATHPERVSALILHNSSARYLIADDYQIGVPAERVDEIVDVVRSTWGKVDLQRLANPGLNPRADRLNAKIGRAAATPRAAAAQYDYLLRSVDVRDLLPDIQAPTLVFHKANLLVPIEHGRYLAEHIPGASFVELEGSALAVDYSDPTFTAKVREFLTGEPSAVPYERILATVLFTDMEGSTDLAASLRDVPWERLLDMHDQSTRDQLDRFRGREHKPTGDGFLLSFPSPSHAIECAQAIIDSAHEDLNLELRVGLHSGECQVREDGDLAGIIVNIAARVCEKANPGEILVTRAVRDQLLGTEIQFVQRKTRTKLKGAPGTWELYAVREGGTTLYTTSYDEAPARDDAPRGVARATHRQG